MPKRLEGKVAVVTGGTNISRVPGDVAQLADLRPPSVEDPLLDGCADLFFDHRKSAESRGVSKLLSLFTD